MNGRRALFDSNTIIYLSKKEIPLSLLESFEEHYISVVTYMEVLGYQFKEPKEEEYIKELLGQNAHISIRISCQASFHGTLNRSIHILASWKEECIRIIAQVTVLIDGEIPIIDAAAIFQTTNWSKSPSIISTQVKEVSLVFCYVEESRIFDFFSIEPIYDFINLAPDLLWDLFLFGHFKIPPVKIST